MALKANWWKRLQSVAVENWRVALYVILIVLCVLYSPEEPLKFIYTEF